MSIFRPETSGGGLSCPNLLFQPVSEYLEASSSRNEILSAFSHPKWCNSARGGWI